MNRAIVLPMLLLLNTCACDRKVAPPGTIPPVPRLKKVSFGVDNYRSVGYDAQGRIATLTFRWANPGAGNPVDEDIFRFTYNTGGQLSGATTGHGFSFRYHYDAQGNLSKTEELDWQGRLTAVRTYTFAEKKLLEWQLEATDPLSGKTAYTRKTYTYDESGNLVREAYYEKSPPASTYQITSDTQFSEFDAHPNPDNLFFSYPHYDPCIVYQAHNPGIAVTRDVRGRVLERNLYTCRYNEAGLVVSKTIKTYSRSSDYSTAIAYTYE